VLLEIEFRLQELGKLWGFGFKWPIATAQQAAAASIALETWQKNFTGKAVPPNLGMEVMLGYTKDLEHDVLAPYFLMRGMFNGSESDCQSALQPLLKLMPHVEQYRDIWRAGTYSDLNIYLLTYPTELPPDIPNSARSVARSHIVARQLTPAECSSLIELYRASANPDNFIGFEPYGGAINDIAPDANAFWHRAALMDVFLFSFWLHQDDRAAALAYVTEFDRVVQPLSNGCSYQNYPNRQIQNFGNVYFGGNLARLQRVKRAYDPDNLFTFPQGLGALPQPPVHG
jgi:hypothetical protein